MNNFIFNPNNKRKAFLLSVIFFTAFFSCKKDGELYPKFNPEGLAVSFTDTFSIKTSIVRNDSINAYNVSSSLIGIKNDSIFGLSSAALYTELTLSGANVNFGSNPIIDSVVLSLKYLNSSSFFGSLDQAMNLEVYTLTNGISTSETYSNQDLAINQPSIGSLSFVPNISTDSILVYNSPSDSVYYDPHVRIKLDNGFGQSLLDKGKGASNIVDNNDLKTVVKGLYITPSATVYNSTLQKGEGAIINFDINSSLSTVTLYYHDGTNYTNYSFIINSESNKHSRFDHNYAGTEIEKHFNNTPGFDSTITFIEAMGGLKLKIEIPHLKNLTAIENVLINKAELVFPLNESSNGSLQAIPNMVLTGINEEGNSVFLADNFEGTEYFGGPLKEDNTYRFNIARHVQQLLISSEQDRGMFLLPTSGAISAYRSVLNSEKHPSNKIKLNITYTKP